MAMRNVSVVKIGGSVLTGPPAYGRVAAYIGDRLRRRPDERIVVVVSAEYGTTDALLATARDIVAEPDPSSVDLLWSTGETRSVAILALHLQAAGTLVTAVGIHQAGLSEPTNAKAPGILCCGRFAFSHCSTRTTWLSSPGFWHGVVGTASRQLGRGGSDLTAVLLAAGLNAVQCELVKDVPGYFTTDPNRDPDARPLRRLTYARAMEMADDGCELVQRHALIAARDCGLPLVIRALDGVHETVVDM